MLVIDPSCIKQWRLQLEANIPCSPSASPSLSCSFSPSGHWLTPFPLFSLPSNPSSIQFCFSAESCTCNLSSLWPLLHAKLLTCFQSFFPYAFLHLSTHSDLNVQNYKQKSKTSLEENIPRLHLIQELKPQPRPQTESQKLMYHTNQVFNLRLSSINSKMWRAKKQKAMKPEPRHLLWQPNLTGGGSFQLFFNHMVL